MTEVSEWRPTNRSMPARGRGKGPSPDPTKVSSRSHHRRKFDAPFVAWDTEGYTDDKGIHHTMLVACSTGDHLWGEDLRTADCLDFMLRVAHEIGPYHIHVGFGLGYDFNMLLRDGTRSEIQYLWENGSARIGKYRVALRHRKSLSVLDRTTGLAFLLYDVWSFFQSSFVVSLQKWGLLEDLEVITAGKNRRHSFSLAERSDIIRYCQAELRRLVGLMDQFRDSLRECDLMLNRWDGPGAVAATLFRTRGTKLHMHDMSGGLEHVNRAAQSAYFGGRIELLRFGNHEGPCWYYDIRSAYPKAISILPSLRSGKWKRTRSADPPSVPLSLYHLRYQFEDAKKSGQSSFFPLPRRRPDGTVTFHPSDSSGWFHQPEYDLVREFFPGQYQVVEALVFVPGDQSKPFQWVEDLYNLRSEWKRQGRGSEKVLKLGLNSLYGKMIQQLGWTPERGIPPYHQLEWGGYVTSYTRAALYRAALSSPESIVGFETDGIVTTHPLSVPTGDTLGEWESDEYQGVTYIQSGVYWLLDNSTWTPKFRGFDEGSLTRSATLKAWSEWKLSIPVQSTRFITMGAAMMGDWRKWCRWITADRELHIFPYENAKRDHWPSPGACKGICGKASKRPPSETLHCTEIHWDDPGYWLGVESVPYPLQWRDNPSGYTFAAMMAERNELDSCLYLDDEG